MKRVRLKKFEHNYTGFGGTLKFYIYGGKAYTDKKVLTKIRLHRKKEGAKFTLARDFPNEAIIHAGTVNIEANSFL